MNQGTSNLVRHAYGQDKHEWTRADLLIALYGKAVATLEDVATAIVEQRSGSQFKAHATAILLMEQIVLGVDPRVSSYSGDVFRICEYAMSSLEAADISGINAAAKAFQTLKEGFEVVREEAVAMERRGEIPPLQTGVELES